MHARIHDEFELAGGAVLTPLAVGKTIVHRSRRGLFMVLMSVLCGLASLAMFLGAALAAVTLRDAGVLVALEVVVGVVFGLASAKFVPQALADMRFNRLAYVVRFATDRVVITNVHGEESVALADAAEHPILRGLAVDRRVHVLTRLRAACERLDPLDERRLVLESLLLTDLDPERDDIDVDADSPDSPIMPIFAAIVGPGEVRFFRAAEALSEA